MLVSYKWLEKYVDINVDADKLAELLTMAGITVDLVHHPKPISGIVAGKIKEIEKHPNADKLVICQIDMGKEVLQIVTGAANVEVGQTVPVATVGAQLPGGKIKAAKLRGVPSFGMLCSQSELKVDETTEGKAGIWILPDDIAAGTDLVKELMLDDAVLELDLTPNRSDCLSIINVAHEVATILGTPMHLSEIEYEESSVKIEDMAKVTVQNTALCPRYTARMVQNVTIAPSPLWMQHFLRTAGIRPINNVVDVSNFVLLEWGQPLHTFDYDKLKQKEIVVRQAEKAEKIITLDDQERELTKDMLLICDGNSPVCVAGVMGGQNSGIDDDTKAILLETAYFNPVSIRHTSRDLGLRSESSMRFEKGVDRANLDTVSRRAIQLMVDHCGGKAVSGIIDSAPELPALTEVFVRPAKVNAVLGTGYSEEQIMGAIKSLNFKITAKNDGYNVVIPSYRPDITGEVDLVEEVARLLGFDNIPTTLPYGSTSCGKRTEEQSFMDNLVDFCADLGLNQIVSYSFNSPKEWDKLNLAADSKLRDNVVIMNPLNDDQKVMRTTLLAGLLKAAARNNSRRNKDLLLFEKGNVFLPMGEVLPEEKPYLGILAMGKDDSRWYGAGTERDFFYVKGILEAVCGRFGIKNCEIRKTKGYAYLHPGRAGEIFIDNNYAGFIGEIHPLVADNYELTGKAVVMQLDLSVVYPEVTVIPFYKALPKFPASARDMALVAALDVSAYAIEAVIKKHGGEYLKKVELFDIYQGAQVMDGYRSLAYGLTFQCDERTLTDEEVNNAFEAILAALDKELSVKLR